MISELTRQRLRDSHMGHKRTLESIEKQRQKLLGRKRKPFTLEHKENIKKARANQICPPCSLEKKIKISKANKGKPSINSIFVKGHKINVGRKMSDEQKKKISISNINSFSPHVNYKNTSIEIKIREELIKRNIEFKQNEPIMDIANVDFYLPKYNIVIECDGDYWHNLPGVPENDAQKTRRLTEAGYKVFRFWEHEINKSTVQCVDTLAFHLK